MKSLKITQSITDRQDASLGLYFKDVSKQPILSQEEEVELTRNKFKICYICSKAISRKRSTTSGLNTGR